MHSSDRHEGGVIIQASFPKFFTVSLTALKNEKTCHISSEKNLVKFAFFMIQDKVTHCTLIKVERVGKVANAQPAIHKNVRTLQRD